MSNAACIELCVQNSISLPSTANAICYTLCSKVAQDGCNYMWDYCTALWDNYNKRAWMPYTKWIRYKVTVENCLTLYNAACPGGEPLGYDEGLSPT